MIMWVFEIYPNLDGELDTFLRHIVRFDFDYV